MFFLDDARAPLPLVHLNFCYWRCVEVVFDTGKILSSLFMIFVICEWIIEKNFKTIYKEKDWQRLIIQVRQSREMQAIQNGV
jgi:hypothetical protein